MIINAWDAEFKRKYGTEWPTTYLCFDTEYSGSNAENDLILEIGHTMVENGVIVDQLNVVLNWYDHPETKAMTLDYQLNKMGSIVGSSWRLFPDAVQQGTEPLSVLRFYHKLFATWADRGLPFVAQNGQSADERMLRGNLNRFLNLGFDLPPNGYFDVGGIFKATQIYEATEGDLQNFRSIALPYRTDTLKEYFKRVLGTRISGLKWSLAEMLRYYNLMEKRGGDLSKMHNAEYDSMCLHWLMEEFRERLVVSPVMPSQSFAKELAQYEQQNQKAKGSAGLPLDEPQRQALPTKPKVRQRLL